MTDCRLIRPGATSYAGKQGFDYVQGITAETTGSTGICMMLLTIPPGGRAKAHLHESHETAIYMLKGTAETWWGHNLEHRIDVHAGEMFYIPAGMPHLPINRGPEEAVAVITRTDPNEQESVVLRPDLEDRVPA